MGTRDGVGAIWQRLTAPAWVQTARVLGQFLQWPVGWETTPPAQERWPQESSLIIPTGAEGAAWAGIRVGARGWLVATVGGLLRAADVERLQRLVLGPETAPPEVAASVLAELGNIVASRFLSVFADQIRTMWVPVPPQTTTGPWETVAHFLWEADPHRRWVTEMHWWLQGRPLEGWFAVWPRLDRTDGAPSGSGAGGPVVQAGRKPR
ncbi:MAG: hypothetical protein OWV35_06745 [Firmicutes bacterium]|nr:hypothetical protein [Bacillota bacterium]